MKTGDVVFFKKESTLISRIIARITKSDYTHVALVIAPGVVIESNRWINTSVSDAWELEENRHALYRSVHMNEEVRANIEQAALHFKDMPYDYLQIIQFFFRLVFKWDISFLNRNTHLICSELIDYTYLASGLKRAHTERIGDIAVTELIELYDLKEVAECLEK